MGLDSGCWATFGDRSLSAVGMEKEAETSVWRFTVHGEKRYLSVKWEGRGAGGERTHGCGRSVEHPNRRNRLMVSWTLLESAKFGSRAGCQHFRPSSGSDDNDPLHYAASMGSLLASCRVRSKFGEVLSQRRSARTQPRSRPAATEIGCLTKSERVQPERCHEEGWSSLSQRCRCT